MKIVERQVENADARPIEASLSVRDLVYLKESELREDIAKKLTKAFVIVNLGVLSLVLLATILDHWFIAHQYVKGAERLVTTPLLISIVGATTVQLGTIVFAMSNWLFPNIKGQT